MRPRACFRVCPGVERIFKTIQGSTKRIRISKFACTLILPTCYFASGIFAWNNCLLKLLLPASQKVHYFGTYLKYRNYLVLCVSFFGLLKFTAPLVVVVISICLCNSINILCRGRTVCSLSLPLDKWFSIRFHRRRKTFWLREVARF